MPTISEIVKVKDGESVTLEILIGSGQIGAPTILLDSRELTPKEANASRSVYELGSGAALRFSVLIGTIKVRDISAATNQTTITAIIVQGSSKRIFEEHAEAAPGGVVNYGLGLTFT